MKRILKSKQGVTILEGVVAMGMLAMVAAGSFAVLLSVSRQASQPDMREEMMLAVEKAHDKLKAFQLYSTHFDLLPESLQHGLCDDDAETNPLGNGTHDISCMLPPICDKNNDSDFAYTVTTKPEAELTTLGYTTDQRDFAGEQALEIAFVIHCNGYNL